MRRAIGCKALLFVLLQICALGGYGQTEAQTASTGEQRLWSLLVVDEGSDSRIRKWLLPKINTLMIVDQEYASNVVSQISQLVDEFNKQSPIHVALCADVVRPSVKLYRQSGMDCAVEEFDSYMVVTNGHWGNASWAGVLVAMPTWASDRLQVLMKRVEADAARGTCELVLRPRNDGSYEIGGAVSVIDFSNKKGVGACFVSVFLGSMGVSPFEGKDRLDVRAEAASYAEFLLKQKPSGGLYLTKMLYSPALSAGMGEAQAKQVLEKLILDTE